ncbi:MAG: SusC/RagA family TonB-linked outer membrane protein, partial [Bacteroidales bacterium]|nr:SusC/RagA family TonB-linked outer membrane protein [Bacteroidales bacterium]
SVPSDAKILVFKFVGMIPQEIEIGSQKVIDVALEPDILDLEGVVVTALGIERETKALGYGVSNVNNEEIAKSANSDIINALAGRASGVEVISSSGAAGAPSYITVRGATSIIGNNQPLFVVDGVPIDNTTTMDDDGFANDDVAGVSRSNRALDLNPDDIENISILKGGAATALYGMRGANGVIIVTTKKGVPTTGKKISVNFNSSLTFEKISQVPELNEKYGQGWGGQWIPGFFASWGPNMDTMSWSKDPGVWTTPEYDVDGAMVPGSGISPYDQYDFFQTGVFTNNFISFVGGNDRASFYASIGDNRGEGVVPNNKIQKNTFTVRGDSKVNDWFFIGGSANYIVNTGDRIQQGSNTSGVMLGLLRTPPSFNNAAGYELPDGSQRTYRAGGGYDNPYWTANKNKYRDVTNRLIGNVNFTAKATDWLTFTYRLGVDNYSTQVKNYMSIYSRSEPAGYVYARNYLKRDINSDLLAYITRDVTEDITLTGTFGWNMTELFSNWVEGKASGQAIPEYYNLNNSSNLATKEATQKIRRAGLFYDIGFSWRNMVYFNTTGRNDWSTTLPKENNSFFYPSANASFIFTELPGLSDNDILPYGKIRVSYAKVALDATPYRTLNYYRQAADPSVWVSDGWVQPHGVMFPVLGYNAFSYSDLMGSDELKPESTTTLELGFDLKFLQNRIGLGFTYFDSKSKDLLLPVSIDPSTGFSDMFVNAAKMESYGIEIDLYATIIKNENFRWDLGANFTTFKNPVTELYPNVEAIFLGGFTDPQIRAVAGEEYRTIYGYDWLRDGNGNILIDDDPNSPGYGYPTGDYNFSVLGKVNADWRMGINTTVAYKNISLYMLFDIKSGGQMWNGTKGALYYFGTHGDTEDRDENYVFEGVKMSDGTTNDISVKLDQNWRTNLEGSGFTGPTVDYIEDANWVRLRDLTLSYNFTDMLESTLIRGLELYFTAKNLWVSTPYEGIDPETSLLGASNAQGMDYFNMPGTKSYTIGLRLAL